ncbi:hypothetical protein T4E_6542 [Trichinella pseudospiralis]|uniref:Uncharacterized protein n=1 Tax=Trichinella pseudospiralis TaxID=6337 RepID=A0A0V0WPT9_TRIPS|nr:hypothetical protein T4E_6542 [Trichinella pseudospiralis]
MAKNFFSELGLFLIFALAMLIHYEVVSFLKISREAYNQGKPE